MTEPNYTDAQIESQADFYAGFLGSRIEHGADMLRSLLSERQAAMQRQGGNAMPTCKVIRNEAGQVYIDWRGRSINDFIGNVLYLDGQPAQPAQVDGHLEMAIAIERVKTTHQQPAQEQPGWKAPPDCEIRLFDSQWMNIINHDNCYRDFDKSDAVACAVKMTEEAIARNAHDGKWPKNKSASPTPPKEN
jgi:hypothetical protein